MVGIGKSVKLSRRRQGIICRKKTKMEGGKVEKNVEVCAV